MNRAAVVLAFWSAVAVQAWPGHLIGGGTFSSSGGGFSGHGGLGGYGDLKSSLAGGVQGPTSLDSFPDLHSFDGFKYHISDLQDLGTVYEGQIPPKTVRISNTISVDVPKPYPVKVPHNVPIPVPVPKPYPVQVTKIVKVPHPVPVEIVKKVPFPIEVPKPYPVPSHDYKDFGKSDSYEGSFNGHQQQSQSAQGGHDFSGGGYDYKGFGQSDSYEGSFNGHQQQSQSAQGGHDLNGGGYDAYASQPASASDYGGGYEGHADQSAAYSAAASATPVQEGSQEQADSHNQ